MRSQTQPQKGLTILERNHQKYQSQKDSKQKTATYNLPKLSQELTNRPQTQIYKPSQKMKEKYQELGQQFMSEKGSLALVVFAGGYGCRAGINQKSKEFRVIKVEEKTSHMKRNKQSSVINKGNKQLIETTLFKILFDSLEDKLVQNQNITVYIICSRKNNQLIANQVRSMVSEKYQALTVYICEQNEGNVMDWNGVESIYISRVNKQKLTYPDGIGSFPKSKLPYNQQQQYSLGFHLTNILKPQLVYCIGLSNKKQQGINLEMIGLILQNKLSCVFQCSMPETTNRQLPVVCVRQEDGYAPAWLVMEYGNLEMLVKNGELRNYPIWMDNFVFDPSILDKEYEYNKSEVMYQFNPRKLQGYNGQKLNCLIPQATISFTVMRQKKTCIGYVCNEGRFLKTKQDFQKNALDAQSYSPSKIIKGRT